MRFAAAIICALFAGGQILAWKPPPPGYEANGGLPQELRRLPYPHDFVMALQICLDRRGFSPNTIDGQYGAKSQVAMATYCAANGLPEPDHGFHAKFWQMYFPGETNLLKSVVVTDEDVAALVSIPRDPATKAKLSAMGYETLQEMFAERGHLSQIALKRLNPDLAWPNPPVGSCVTIPDFSVPFPWTPMKAEAESAAGRGKRPAPIRAAVLRVSVGRCEITAFDKNGRLIALFPCSIAADKAKRPASGELQVKSIVPNPNYTYTPDHTPRGKKVERHMFPPGPNNPVGVAWVGLTLPGYGMHGTPIPERIGRAESHGCFRLANWNADRLLKMCEVGVPVVVEAEGE